MHRRVLAHVGLAVASCAVALPAAAAPKTITKSFDVNIPVPMAGSTGSISAACSQGSLPELPAGSVHIEEFAAPAPGTLKVEVTGFMGDWDMALDVAGKRAAEGAGTTTPDNMSTGSSVEKLTYKVKKAGSVEIVVCNFVGGPTGTGKYTFTYG